MISGIGGTASLNYMYQLQSMSQNNGLSADELFNSIDTNGDGTVSKDELEKHRAERQAGLKSPMTNSQDAMASLISLLNGPVQIGSTNGITNAQDLISSLMNQLDSSAQTGSTGTAAGAQNGASSADAIFNKMDTDKDGSISKAEFEKFHAGKGRGHHHGPPPASNSQAGMTSLLDSLQATADNGNITNSASDQNATNGLTSFVTQALEKYFQSTYASGNTTNSGLVNTVG